jgi:hypothetical protein
MHRQFVNGVWLNPQYVYGVPCLQMGILHPRSYNIGHFVLWWQHKHHSSGTSHYYYTMSIIFWSPTPPFSLSTFLTAPFSIMFTSQFYPYDRGLKSLSLYTLLHKSPDIHYVEHKLVKNTLPSHHGKQDDTRVPPNFRRVEKQSVSRHPGWLDFSL